MADNSDRCGQRGRSGRSLALAVAGPLLLVILPACSSGGGDDDDALATLSVRADVVEVASGDADFEAVGEERDLAVGDAILTDASGRGQVDYADGSLTRLGADTEFELVELAERDGPKVTVTSLDVGDSYHRVADLTESGDSYEVQTASATAAVAGTVFAVSCLEDGSCVITVLEGEVIVTLADGTEITLRAGQRLVIDADGNAGEIEDLSPDQILDDPWLAENLELDEEQGFELPEMLDGRRDSAASIGGVWDVELRATAAEGFRDVAVGDVRERTYEIDVDCDGLGCALLLGLEGADDELRVPLVSTGGAYRAVVSGLGTQDCLLDDDTVAVAGGLQSEAVLDLEVTNLEVEDGLAVAIEMAGTARETAQATGGNSCLPASATYEITMTREV